MRKVVSREWEILQISFEYLMRYKTVAGWGTRLGEKSFFFTFFGEIYIFYIILLREVWDEWDRVSTSGANQVGGIFSKFSESCLAKTVGAEGFSEIEILNMSNTLLRIAHCKC